MIDLNDRINALKRNDVFRTNFGVVIDHYIAKETQRLIDAEKDSIFLHQGSVKALMSLKKILLGKDDQDV